MYDAVSDSALIEELEVGARVDRQRRLAPTDDYGPDEQLALVNQPGKVPRHRWHRDGEGSGELGDRGVAFGQLQAR